jgi:16S rRNA (adenine(1408)-N(1))-methyltransferase
VVEPPDNSINVPSETSSPLTGEGIVVDIGTGDGLFVYQCAQKNSKKFYIGIDANPRPLEKISEKIHRKPAKGGLSNVLFIQSAVEELPPELNGVADEVHVHFPWGSLLGAMATGDGAVLNNLRRICSAGALLEVVIGLDPERDRTETERLGLPSLSITYIDSTLRPNYRVAGFEIFERGDILPSEWPKLQTSWAKRLQGNANRSLIYIIARAV